MDSNDKYTRRDSKADTGDLPEMDWEELTKERERRAMSYRERQRQESLRQAAARPNSARTSSARQANPSGRTAAQPASRHPHPSSRPGEQQSRPVSRQSAQPRAGAAAGKKNGKKRKKKMSTAYRVICGILGTLIGLIVVFAAAAVIYLSRFDMNLVEIDANDSNNMDSQYTEVLEDDEGEEIRVLDPIYEGDERDSFRDAIREWRSQGNAYLQSNKVINVLLVGIDRNEDGSNGRSDTMILASLNMKNKTITLSSFYRDSWMYETFDNGERTAWAKLNASFVYGGAEGLIGNIEDYYKIHIDHYVGVDFQGFQSVVDAVGGVVVPVQEHEAEYINEQLCYDAVQPGEAVTISGDVALWYVRMRHSDADEEVSRTRRQRQFITGLINEFKSLSLSEIDDVVSSLFQYVETDMTKTQIVTYGIRAMTGKWYNYQIQQQQVPDEPYRWEYNGSTWVWIVDYPGAAYAMQNTIYGYSNIVLNEDRYTIVDIAKALDRAGYQVV